MNEKYRNYYLIGITAFLLAVIFYLVTWHGYNVPKYNYQAGQIAQVSIKAPFAFNVLKTDKMLDAEVTRTIQNYPPIYMISEETKFNLQKRLDQFFIELSNLTTIKDSTYVKDALSLHGVQINYPTLNYLMAQNVRNKIYTFLSEQFSKIMILPIINDNEKNKVFRISSNFEVSEKLSNEAISISEAKVLILKNVIDPIERYIVSEITNLLLESNLVLDAETMNKEKENIRRSLDPIITRVENNEFITFKNERLTEQHILKLESLTKSLIDKRSEKDYFELFVSAFGQFLYNSIILSLFYFLTMFFFKESFYSFNKLVLSNSAYIITILIITFIYYIVDIKNTLLIPFPMIVLLITITFNASYGILFSFFLLILSGQYLNWNMLPLINLLICSNVSILVLKKTKQVNYLLLFLYVLASFTITSIITALYRNESFTSLSLNLFYGLINSLVSILGIVLLSPILEDKLENVPKQKLLKLMDFNNPLLKRLSKEATGTYYHALIVGNIAEECAEAISANPLIARVGSYYHDIGKLENPSYFTENIQNSENKHDYLNPVESAELIKNHVKNGILLAKKAKIPEVIIDIIQQHHGDSKVKYFYYKAKQSGEEVNDKDFTYPGPKPKTKEAVIVMIADIVESATKSLKEHNKTIIENIIDETIKNLIAEKQLINAPITLRELNIIKEKMLPILDTIHSKRIQYPDDKK